MAITLGDVTITAIPTAAARAKRVLVVLLMIAVIAWIAPRAMASDSSDAGGAGTWTTDTWTVAHGETLWSIAAAYTGPGENVRDTLDEIMALNALESTAIRTGDQLLVPSAD